MADNPTEPTSEAPKAEVQEAVQELKGAVDATPKEEATPAWASRLTQSLDNLTQEMRTERESRKPLPTSPAPESEPTPAPDADGETAIVVEKQPPQKPKTLRDQRRGKTMHKPKKP